MKTRFKEKIDTHDKMSQAASDSNEVKTESNPPKQVHVPLTEEEKQRYRQEEQEKGITYCNIEHRCFNVCNPGKTTCDTCTNIMYYLT